MFKFLDRKEGNFIVLIPGWAFDYRIFSTLDLPYNYFCFCGKGSIFQFEKELVKLLRRNGIEKISLLGWSQGAYLASRFACKNPDFINEVILISIKQRYEKEDLEKIKAYLKRNKNAYLYKFYKECFSANEARHFSWFRKNLLNDYLENMKLEDLISGLDMFYRADLKAKSLRDLRRVKIVHGTEDRIASIKEAIDLKGVLKEAKVITFEDTGHLPFLREDFRKSLYG